MILRIFLVYLVFVISTSLIVANESVLFISPNFDGHSDTLKIEQTGSKKQLWVGQIINSKNKVIKSFKWENSIPKDFTWDGYTDYGRLVQDGEYRYELLFIDEIGRRSEPKRTLNIIVDGSTPKVKIDLDNSFISPNGDNIKDFGIAYVKIEAINKLKKHTLKLIREDNKRAVNLIPIQNIRYKYKISGVTPDGEILPNGYYAIQCYAEYENGYISLDSSRIHIYRGNHKINISIRKEPLFYDDSEILGSYCFEIGIGEIANIDSWSLKLKGSNNEIVYYLNGNENPISNFKYSNLGTSKYTLEFNLKDKNGNNLSKAVNFTPEVEFIKSKNNIYLRNLEIFFEPYKTEASIDRKKIDLIVGILNKYPKSTFIIESNAYDDGTNIKDLDKLSEKRGLYIKKLLNCSGLKNSNIELLPNKASKTANRSVKIIFKNII